METKIDFLSDRLTRNETKLDDLEKAVNSPGSDQETRIRKLEKIVWIAMGFAAALGGTVGGFVSNLMGG